MKHNRKSDLDDNASKKQRTTNDDKKIEASSNLASIGNDAGVVLSYLLQQAKLLGSETEG